MQWGSIPRARFEQPIGFAVVVQALAWLLIFFGEDMDNKLFAYIIVGLVACVAIAYVAIETDIKVPYSTVVEDCTSHSRIVKWNHDKEYCVQALSDGEWRTRWSTCSKSKVSTYRVCYGRFE